MKIRIRIVGIVFWIAAAGFIPFSMSWAYEEKPVTDGATITGKAVFKGTVPPPRQYGLIVYPDMELCERISDGKGHRILRDFTVSPDGGLQSVVVVVEDVQRGKPFHVSGPKITIRDCEFRPFMTVVRDYQNITFENHDAVVHDIQAYAVRSNQRGDRIFDRAALASATLVQQIELPKQQKIVWTQCGKHSFMQTWAYAVENPYYAITAEDGTYTITDLPPGRYRITAWHPFMKLREQTIDVPSKGRAVVDFEFGK